jgi:hypothetical protein
MWMIAWVWSRIEESQELITLFRALVTGPGKDEKNNRPFPALSPWPLDSRRSMEYQ